MGLHNEPVGYFLGHCCGITSVTSREDGYFVASNSKYYINLIFRDQSLKLWDLRKMATDINKPRTHKIYDYRHGPLN